MVLTIQNTQTLAIKLNPPKPDVINDRYHTDKKKKTRINLVFDY